MPCKQRGGTAATGDKIKEGLQYMTNQMRRLLLQCQPAYMVQLNTRTEFIIIFKSCVYFVECLRR